MVELNVNPVDLVLTNNSVTPQVINRLVNKGRNYLQNIQPLPSVGRYRETLYVLDGNKRISAYIQMGISVVTVRLRCEFDEDPEQSLLNLFQYRC